MRISRKLWKPLFGVEPKRNARANHPSKFSKKKQPEKQKRVKSEERFVAATAVLPINRKQRRHASAPEEGANPPKKQKERKSPEQIPRMMAWSLARSAAVDVGLPKLPVNQRTQRTRQPSRAKVPVAGKLVGREEDVEEVVNRELERPEERLEGKLVERLVVNQQPARQAELILLLQMHRQKRNAVAEDVAVQVGKQAGKRATKVLEAETQGADLRPRLQESDFRIPTDRFNYRRPKRAATWITRDLFAGSLVSMTNFPRKIGSDRYSVSVSKTL